MAERGAAQYVDDGKDGRKISQGEDRRSNEEPIEGQVEPADGDIAGKHQARHDPADEDDPEHLAAEPVAKLPDSRPDEISPRQRVVTGKRAQSVEEQIAGHHAEEDAG